MKMDADEVWMDVATLVGDGGSSTRGLNHSFRARDENHIRSLPGPVELNELCTGTKANIVLVDGTYT